MSDGDGKGAGRDPSMDDILSSIRKIISEDEARSQAAGASPAPLGMAPPPAEPAGEPKPFGNGRVGTSSRDDILLLTDLIEEPAQGMPAPRVAPQPPAEPASPPPAAGPAADHSLLGSTASEATASAFERLSQAMKSTAPPPAAVVDPGPALGAGGKTLEDMVKETLRPLLREWLDKNLPAVVERAVEREIVRLTRR